MHKLKLILCAVLIFTAACSTTRKSSEIGESGCPDEDSSLKVKYDITDEAIINASPDLVFNAIIDEACGKTSWWMPYLSFKPREESTCSIGDLIDVVLHGKYPLKFTAKTAEVKRNEMIIGSYIEGAFAGEYVWTLKDLGDKTKISYRWRVNPKGFLLRMIAPFASIEKKHSAVMQAGFKNLNKFLAQKTVHANKIIKNSQSGKMMSAGSR
ncbi:MAG: hypothetical protein SWH61_08505 [Thermodesulfobacteriota bacterium]|nr:hypothetical protein [Thermodesulfobacteriota bacterium]